jgi:hypothetical protein
MFYGLIKGYFFGIKTSTEISTHEISTQKYQLRFEVLNWMSATAKLDYRKKETKKAGLLLTLPLLFQN